MGNSSPCPPANTLVVPRTFQVVSMDPPEPSQEDTPSPPRSKTPKPVTAPLTLRSRTDVVPCLGDRLHDALVPRLVRPPLLLPHHPQLDFPSCCDGSGFRTIVCSITAA